MVLMSQQKRKNGGDILLGEMLGSAVLDSGASSTVCGTKWYKCFLETLTDAQKKKIVKIKWVRTFKFGDGNKLKSLYQVILPCVIADIEVSIITDVVDSDIPLLLSKDAMKMAGTCLNFEDDTVTMLKKKIPLSRTLFGHYYIPITKPLPDKRKFKHIPFIKEISSKNTAEKIKIATKLHRQFNHPSCKKLCDLVKNAGVTDPEFIKFLLTVPNVNYAFITKRLNLNLLLEILIWRRWPVVQNLGFLKSLCISRHPRKKLTPSLQTESH